MLGILVINSISKKEEILVEVFYIITQEGFEKLHEERGRIERELRSLADQKKEAPAEEGFSEKEQLNQDIADLQEKLAKIQAKISSAKIVPNPGEETVDIGSKVLVEFLENGKQKDFKIGDSECIDPNNGKVSHKSPIGRSLLGKREGDICEYTVHSTETKKSVKLKIIKIEKE